MEGICIACRVVVKRKMHDMQNKVDGERMQSVEKQNPSGLGWGANAVGWLKTVATAPYVDAVLYYHWVQTKYSPTANDRRGVCRGLARGDEKVRSRIGAGIRPIRKG